MESDDYDRFPAFEAEKRKNILWSYIDARDVVSACRLAIEKDGLGAVILNIASDDTSMSIKSNELMATCYPNVTDIGERFIISLLCLAIKWQKRF